MISIKVLFSTFKTIISLNMLWFSGGVNDKPFVLYTINSSILSPSKSTLYEFLIIKSLLLISSNQIGFSWSKSPSLLFKYPILQVIHSEKKYSSKPSWFISIKVYTPSELVLKPSVLFLSIKKLASPSFFQTSKRLPFELPEMITSISPSLSKSPIACPNPETKGLSISWLNVIFSLKSINLSFFKP